MTRTARILGFATLSLAALVVAPTAAGAATPAVYSVVEGKDTDTGKPVLVLLGNSLTACKSYELADAGGNPVGAVTLEVRSKNMLVLGLPDGLPQGSYTLTLGYGKGLTQDHKVGLTNGVPLPGTVQDNALTTSLRDDLDDAATLGGHPTAWFADASNLASGTLDPARFSAFGDLAAESKIGPAAGQVAAGDHAHDARYYQRSEADALFADLTGLVKPGTVNDAGNPVDWTRLKGVPAGFADGVDNGSVYTAGSGLSVTLGAFSVNFAGTGTATTASRSDHDHNATYYTQAALNAAGGTLNAGTNPVDWSRLKGVPAGFADGVDNDAWTTSGSNVYRASGRVGIGATSPTATLHVSGIDGALFQGTYGSGAIPATGAGTRMMWYPGKASFRAGYVNGTQWDDATVGAYSTAMGSNTIASALGSTAMGRLTIASGDYSASMGYNTIASGDYSASMCYNTTASGNSSASMGNYTTASGVCSTATGSSTIASGDFSTGMGVQTTAQAYGSLALGRLNVVAGTTNSWVATDPVLVVGNGTSTSARANAFTLFKNGNLTIAGTLTQASDLRLKTDLLPLGATMAKIAALHGVSYRFKDGATRPAGRQIGLVAQEVREVFPELVQEGADGTLSVAYGNLSAVLVEAVKEQQAALDAREREIAALRKELSEVRSAVEARLARIEKAMEPASAATPEAR